MKEYDDANYRKNEGSFFLALKSEKDKQLSTWEISRFIFDLNTYYYKFEVINAVSVALSNGVLPQNILILDESFMLNRQYGKLDLLDFNKSDLAQVYFMGLPYSMLPNANIVNMRIVLKYFRLVNEELFRLKKARNPAAKVGECFLIAKNEGIEKAIEFINANTLRRFKIKAENDNIRESLESLKKQIKNDIANENKEKVKQEKFFESLGSKPTKKKILSYHVPFFTLINRLQRPVVIVYNPKSGMGRILCRSQLNKRKNDNRTFILRKVNQNSPLDLLVQGGLSIAMAWSGEKRNKELHEAELVLKRTQAKKAQTEADIATIELMSKQIDLLKKIADLQANPEYSQISRLVNPYLKEQLAASNAHIVNNFQNLGARSGLEVNYSESHIDYEA